jgi:hypothetical protein
LPPKKDSKYPFDAAYTDTKGRNVGKFLNNPKILRHSIMQAMFDPEELKPLTSVKLDKSNPARSQLRASIHEERKWHQVA